MLALLRNLSLEPSNAVTSRLKGFIISPQHIALANLWNLAKHSVTLTQEEEGHLAACHRCRTAAGLCNQSKTLKEAERRYRVFVINGSLGNLPSA